MTFQIKGRQTLHIGLVVAHSVARMDEVAEPISARLYLG